MAYDRWAVGNREVRVARRRTLDWQIFLSAMAATEKRPDSPRWVRDGSRSEGAKKEAVR